MTVDAAKAVHSQSHAQQHSFVERLHPQQIMPIAASLLKTQHSKDEALKGPLTIIAILEAEDAPIQKLSAHDFGCIVADVRFDVPEHLSTQSCLVQSNPHVHDLDHVWLHVAGHAIFYAPHV
jgi:hypothetical protein